MNLKQLFLLLVFLFSVGSLPADTTDVWLSDDAYISPEEQHHFDNEKWEELVNGLEYKEDIDRPKEEEKKEKESKEKRGINTVFWSTFFKYFAIVASIGLVSFLIYYVLNNANLSGPKNNKIRGLGKDFNIEDVEENLEDAQVDDFLQQALFDKKYALAVRLYYLKTIKILAENQHIKWERDKTNQTYINELSGKELEQGFRTITPIFERVWYGNRTLKEQDFHLIQPQFERFISSIQPTTTDASL